MPRVFAVPFPVMLGLFGLSWPTRVTLLAVIEIQFVAVLLRIEVVNV